MKPVLDFDRRDFLLSAGGLPVPIERLRMLARARLMFIIPTAVLPTAFFLWSHVPEAWHPQAGRIVALSHSILLGFYIVSSGLLYALARRPRLSTDRSVRIVSWMGIICEVLTTAAYLLGTGSLANHSLAFFIVIIGIYRVVLGFGTGLFALSAVLVTFAACSLLELAEIIPISPLLAAPLVHPAWMDPMFSGMVIAGVIFTSISTFIYANYAENQSIRLHRYITQFVLRRYLPPSLVAKAAKGELHLDAPPERRVVTVMFTDLVGFTALSERLGPTGIGEALNNYLATVADIAHAHGATVDKFIGDCVMMVLGAPEPLPEEEQARRAVVLALAVHDAVPLMSDDPPLQARTGINTGEVVAGNFGSANRSDYTVLGHAVNVAARLESKSEPGRILIGPDTAALLGGDVKLEPTEPMELKGVSEPVIGYFLAAD